MRKFFALLLTAAMGTVLVAGAGCSGHRHEFGDWQVIYDATCLREGLMERSCKSCEETQSKKIERTSHTLGVWSADANGHWHTCSVCGLRQDDGSHTFSGDVCTGCGYDKRGTAALNYTLNSDKASYTLTGSTGELPSNVYIPDNYVGLPVTDIAASAFKDKKIVSVTLPARLSSIGNSAFSGCTRLQQITIPASVKSIGSNAFLNCESLTRIDVQQGNESYASQNGILLDRELTRYIHVPALATGEVDVPAGVTEIPGGIFSGRKGITAVNMQEGVTKIGEMAFKNCTGIREMTVPKSVTSIGKSAFAFDDDERKVAVLEKLTLPYTWQDGVTVPSYDPPNKVWKGESFIGYIFGATTYYGCGSAVPASLKTLEFTGGTKLEKYLLYHCANLERIVLPDILDSIEANAFAGCTGLKSINIPKNLTSVESSAFDDCAGLETITVAPENTAYTGIDGVLYNKPTTKIEFVPASIGGDVHIPEGVTTIGARAFSGSKIETLALPDSLRRIEDRGFNECSLLRTVEISDNSSLTSIGEYCFFKCILLESFKIPASMNAIGLCAFADCSGLSSVEFKDPYNWQYTFNAQSESTTPASSAVLADPSRAAQELISKASHSWSKKEA